MDVAANAEGVRAEAATGRPLMSLAHATFSGGVMVSSLPAGGGLAVALALAARVAAPVSRLAATPS